MVNRALLFLILRSAFGYDDITKHEVVFSEDSLKYLYNAAKVHSLFPIVSNVLIENRLISSDSPYYQPFRKQMLKFALRREQFDFVLDIVCRAFDRENIAYIPLKGSVLKALYPESWMRTGTDIDILVKKCDIDKAERVLSEELKYTYFSRSSHDVVYTSDTKVHIELHFSLNEPGYRLFEPLEHIWDVAERVNGSHCHKMSSEYILLYHIAHMAKHFVCGGCGARFVTDLRVIIDKLNINTERSDNLLKICGLTKFYEAMIALCDVWFLQKPHSKLTEALELYIMTGGTFGNLANKAALGQAKKGSRLKYAIARVFLSYDQMVSFYPILDKHKWLTPFYEVKRWFRIIFCGGLERSTKELKFNSSVDESKAENAKFLAENLDL